VSCFPEGGVYRPRGRTGPVVREVRRTYDRETSVPGNWSRRFRRRRRTPIPTWKQAREEDDFEQFAPTLEKLVELKREYANHIDPDADPYAVLFADYEPYIDLETAERVLERLRENLVPLIDAVQESDAELTTDAFAGQFDDDDQEALARDVLDSLATTGIAAASIRHRIRSPRTQFDARVTTRFEEGRLARVDHLDDPRVRPRRLHAGSPGRGVRHAAGRARDLSVHGSQSRLWENHVGRSRPFWEHFLPIARERFPELGDVSPREAYEAANRVHDDNLIRVEADELTYHLHIVIRFEIERDLIRAISRSRRSPRFGTISTRNISAFVPKPTRKAACRTFTGLTATSATSRRTRWARCSRRSCTPAAEDDRGTFDEQIREGEFDELNGWLRENVHRHGKRYVTPALIERATGEELTADYFLEYVTSKYGELYDLEDG